MGMRGEFDEDFSEKSDDRDVKFLSLTWRYFWLLILFGGVGTGAAYLHFLKQPPTYQSSSTILVTGDRQNQANPLGTESTLAQGATPTMPHQMLVGSPLVVRKAVEARDLRKNPAFAGGEDPVKRIVEGLHVLSDVKTPDVIRLSFQDTDPEVCRLSLEAVLEGYRSFLGETHETISEDVVKLITEAKDVLLTKMEEKEKGYRNFRQEAPLLFAKEAGATNIHQERLAGIEQARSALLIALHEKTAELDSLKNAMARGGNREALALIINANKESKESGLPQEKSPVTELFPLLLEEQMLLETLGPDHPKVTAVQKRIEITRKYLTESLAEERKNAGETPMPKGGKRPDLVALYLESLQHEVDVIQNKQKEMDLLFDKEKEAAKSLVAFEIQDEGFRNDIARTSKIFEGVVKRLDEISLVKNYGGYEMSVISPPAAGTLTGPVMARYLTAGAIAGIAVGYLLAYLLELNDRSFRDAEEVQTSLGLPVVGHVPVIELSRADWRSQGPVHPSLVTFHRPKSRLAEAYRAVRTSLYFRTRGEPLKVIQVTSPNPGDGKSTLSGNLAVSIAQTGKRVLLMDADFRRPRIHRLIGQNTALGVSSVIAGTAELMDAIQDTPVENLSVLGCGPRPDNPAELLTGKRFEELLGVLREQYDFIIIDTPPLLAVTDPSAVAARVDAVIVTLRIAKRTRSEARRAMEILAGVGANVLGIVVNGVSARKGYGYSGSNGRGYAYGEGKAGIYYSDDDPIASPAPAQRGA